MQRTLKDLTGSDMRLLIRVLEYAAKNPTTDMLGSCKSAQVRAKLLAEKVRKEEGAQVQEMKNALLALSSKKGERL